MCIWSQSINFDQNFVFLLLFNIILHCLPLVTRRLKLNLSALLHFIVLQFENDLRLSEEEEEEEEREEKEIEVAGK